MIKVILTSSDQEIELISSEYQRQTGQKPHFLGKPVGITFSASTDNGPKWLGSVVYSGFNWENNKMVNCQAFAVGSPNWVHPGVLYYMFAVPFYIFGVNRITLTAIENNKPSITWINDLGFTYEGSLRMAVEGKYDKHLYGMLKDECKWLTDKRCLREMKKYSVDPKLQSLLNPYQS